jgi:hypothetical protein
MLESKDPANVEASALASAEFQQAQVFKNVMIICLNEPACKCLMFWDVVEFNSAKPTMVYSWLHPADDGTGQKLYTFPTPLWDINPLTPKRGWYVMQEAMKGYSTGKYSGGIAYRLSSSWQSGTGYLARRGLSQGIDSSGSPNFVPDATVGLFSLNAESSDWTSMKWHLERVTIVDGDGVYRISCTWGENTGYLTRGGKQDAKDPNVWYAAQDIYLRALNSSWTSQQWRLHYVRGETYTISSTWTTESGADYLSRQGSYDTEKQSWFPTPDITLTKDEDKNSQKWLIKRIWSDGDTQVASDAFWN